MATKAQIDMLLPGGIWATDHIHRGKNNNTCSRCEAEITEEEVPLMLWSPDGNNMLIYCNRCLGMAEELDGDHG